MNNKIPIISTKSGNLKYLLDNYAIFINDLNMNDWKNNIEDIYFIKEKITKFSKKNNKLNDEIIENKIIKTVESITTSKYKLNNNNIGIIVPWADQGLGIQGREYYLSLKEIGYNPFIFSFKPYHANNKNNFLQTDKSEWDYENITYSPNNRENITYDEILDFIYYNKIKKIIIIEANFMNIFNIAALLKMLNIDIYIVVNIECININELKYHNIFNKIITNNTISKSILSQIFENKTEYLGFHLNHEYFNVINKKETEYKNLKFCCIGGLNSISRKNIDIIIKTFYNLYEENIFINWTLNIYIQDIEIPEILNEYKCKNIIYHIKYLSYKEIINKLSENDIFIHMGNQEGLGIGFYESLYCGTPIFTLNWSPNNEIIINNENGWLIDCDFTNINDITLINKGNIIEENIKNKLIKIMYDISYTENIINNTIKNREEFYKKNKESFFENFKRILN
jgi:glycosyltransferase involved in cell wall biosynthesis